MTHETFDGIMQRTEGKRLDIEFEGIPLETAIERLGAQYGEKLAVEWRALREESIEPATVVSLERRQATLDEAIERLAFDDKLQTPLGLAYSVRGETIVITTQQDAANDVIACLYDTRHLEQQIYGRSLAPFDPADARGGGLFGSVAPAVRVVSQTMSREEFAELVGELIRETIEVGTWKEDGGAIGTVMEWDGMLIVTHRPLTQMKISRYLQRLALLKPGDSLAPATQPTSH